MRLIASAVMAHLRYLNREVALAIADTVLRSFKVAGLSIKRRRRNESAVKWTDRNR